MFLAGAPSLFKGINFLKGCLAQWAPREASGPTVLSLLILFTMLQANILKYAFTFANGRRIDG